MGLNDDWSYIFIARGLARTGHLRYDGWVTPMIGFQAWWAAFLIRLFGFSFTVVRFSTLPFAAGCAAIIYRLGRDAGLSASLALLGTLTVTLSPLFIPLAASFMTDVPGLFFWLACIYCGIRAARASSPRVACGWLAAAAGLGVIGGTIRQAVWSAPLLVIPAVAWTRRRERLVLASAAVCWCLAGLLILICFRWFQAQPYVQIESYSVGIDAPLLRDGLVNSWRLLVACLTFVLPILLMHLAALRKNRTPRTLATVLFVMGALLIFSQLDHGRLLLGNTVTTTGIISSQTETFGRKPVIITAPILWALRIVLFAGVAATLALGIGKRAGKRAPAERSFRLFLMLYAPAAALYAAAVLYHTLDANVLFDRYVFELLPLVAITLLWRYRHRIGTTVPVTGWISLAVFALYGIATTHDSFAAARARVRAASELIAAGIPRTRITAGFAYDGWTELEHSGHINSEDFVNPPNASQPQEDRHYAVSPGYWFWSFTPSIEPEYFIDHSRIKGLTDAPFPPVPFTAWIPPFHRRAIIQRVPASSAVR